jgi:peptidoglycan/xylan/chitin deacetylase (PgdA/CDA1 family)
MGAGPHMTMHHNGSRSFPLLYRIGAWGSYHRVVNRQSLTVAAFHSVLPKGTEEWAGASRKWTVSTAFFEKCLQFFRQQYRVVSLQQVLSAAEGAGQLPDRSLLITFDDGWDDNERFALALLRRYNMPAVVFAAAGWMGRCMPWNEVVMHAWDEELLSTELCETFWKRVAEPAAPVPAQWDSAAMHALVLRLARLDDTNRENLIRMIPCAEKIGRKRLVTLEQMKRLERGNVAIESHGYGHFPIALCEDPRFELRESRRQIAAMLGRGMDEAPVAISFPHGSYDSAITQMAFEEGYRLLFTSDSCVNRFTNGRPGRILGRIAILEREITDKNGEFCPDLMARWLFRRPARAIG